MSAFDWLLCPHCREPLTIEGRSARCPRGHSYDLARQGYLNLLGHAQGRNADTPEMVARREAFLSAGWYAPIAEAVVEAVGEADRVAEVGAGTGYYLARVLDARPQAAGLGLDVSVPAARRLARAHPRLRAVVADAWQTLPMADGCVEAVLSAFAPRNGAEFARILVPGGVLVTVTPRPGHLASAREQLGLMAVEPDKDERLERSLADGFTRTVTTEVDVDLDLDAAQAADLIGMGPNAFHDHADPRPVRTRAEVTVSRWTRLISST